MIQFISKLDKLKTKRQVQNYLKKVEENFKLYNHDWSVYRVNDYRPYWVYEDAKRQHIIEIERIKKRLAEMEKNNE